LDETQKLVNDFPDMPEYRQQLAALHHAAGNLLASRGEYGEAESEFKFSIRIYEELMSEQPNDPQNHNMAGWACRNSAVMHKRRGDYVGARDLYFRAVALWNEAFAKSRRYKNFLVDGHRELMYVLLDLNDYAGARKHLEEVVVIQPNGPKTMNEFAWLLSTSRIDQWRDGKRAVELASRACEVTHYENPDYINTLAAAYAEAGDFSSAVKWSNKSLELVGENGDRDRRERFLKALALYKDRKPMRQGSLPPAADTAKNEQTRATIETSTESPSERRAEATDEGGSVPLDGTIE
jgi:tetratricopeptide (TPR) repeat protein